ncbi:MAG: hypothetical protein ABR551_08635 [Gemmatimonadales bacterium]
MPLFNALPRHSSPPGRIILLLLLALMAGTDRAAAQAPVTSQGPLRLFLDCQFGCPGDFIRTEIPWVDYVRDRGDADVHLLVSRQGAAVGQLVTFRFIGLGPFLGQDHEIQFTERSTDTESQQREQFVEVLRLGLVRYVDNSPIRDQLRLIYVPSTDTGRVGPAAIHDPWNNWVFQVGGNGSFEGESQSSSSEFRGFLSAERITDQWKLDLYASGTTERNRFTLSNGDEITRTAREGFANVLVGRSLGDRTSFGLAANVQNSTRNNLDLVLRTSAVMELSLYPYRESTRRLITFAYGVGLYSADYNEETIYSKTRETRPRHFAVMSLDLIQPWGQAEFELEAQSYLDDFSQYRVGVSGELETRITRGLSFEVEARYSRVRDQLSLARGDASDDEILLELRQLATDFTFDLSFGLSYTFGSIFSSVVNPRFRSGDPAL